MSETLIPFLAQTLPSETVKSACGLTLDIGRQRMTAENFEDLVAIMEQKGVLEANAAMRRGDIVNQSEGRAALHTALRDPRIGAPYHDQVSQALERICRAAEAIRSGRHCGCRGDVFTDVINVGIGGSEMGPERFTMPYVNRLSVFACISWRLLTGWRLIVSRRCSTHLKPW